MTTSAGQAVLDELNRISQGDGIGDGKECKSILGSEPFNDPEMQEFIMAGYEFAAKNDFQGKMAVAVAWIYLGYRAAQNEVKQ